MKGVVVVAAIAICGVAVTFPLHAHTASEPDRVEQWKQMTVAEKAAQREKFKQLIRNSRQVSKELAEAQKIKAGN